MTKRQAIDSRVARQALGWTLLGAGVAALVLPGRGLLLAAAG